MTDEPGARARAIRPLAAFAIGAAVAGVILLAQSRGDVDRTAYGDGLIYRYVAAHLDVEPENVHEVVRERGTSLRYGRIGLPWLVWLAALGRNEWIGPAHAVVVALSAGVASAAAVLLFPNAGLIAPLLPFIAPGYTLAVSGGYAEALAVPLSLWAVVAVLRDRWWLAGLALAAGMLTKENVVVVSLGLAAWALTRPQRPPLRRVALPLAVSTIPSLLWWTQVRARFGHFGPADPYLREWYDTIGTPFVALFRSVVDPVRASSALLAALHVALAVAAVLLVRRSVYGMIAVFASLQLVQAGPFAWFYLGDAARISCFVQLFAIFAIIAWRRPQWLDERSLARAPA